MGEVILESTLTVHENILLRTHVFWDKWRKWEKPGEMKYTDFMQEVVIVLQNNEESR